MKKHEAFPSKYFKAADVDDDPLTLTISCVDYEKLTDPSGKTQSKPVIRFRGTDKKLVCNQTNFDNIVEVTGKDDYDDWVGHAITLYASEAQVGAKMVPCVRVKVQKETPTRRPVKKKARKQDDDLDDEIPFN